MFWAIRNHKATSYEHSAQHPHNLSLINIAKIEASCSVYEDTDICLDITTVGESRS